MARSTVLYDADCGLCRWTAERLRCWDRAGRLRFIPLHAPRAGELLEGLPRDRWVASWHLVGPGGDVTSAGRAVAPLLRLLPGGSPFAALAERFPGATDRAYRWVADHRAAIGRLIGTTACAVDPSRPR